MDKELINYLETKYTIVTDCGMYITLSNDKWLLSVFENEGYVFDSISKCWGIYHKMSNKENFSMFTFKVVQIDKHILNW